MEDLFVLHLKFTLQLVNIIFNMESVTLCGLLTTLKFLHSLLYVPYNTKKMSKDEEKRIVVQIKTLNLKN